MHPAATFCATIVDQWVAEGLTDAFIAPGSRSTPLALALVRHDDVRCHLFHDERSASFAALGHGLATSRPAVLLCTSGTAATHFHGAVAEADASDVPMMITTADRPPELWGVGAPQTIDQTNLYGGAVRAFLEPGPPGDGVPSFWRPLARTAWMTATGQAGDQPPGPVHLNLSFREPLVGDAGALPEPLGPPRRGPAELDPGVHDHAVEQVLAASSGVIIAGRGHSDPSETIRLAERLGWPLLADHRSGCRRDGASIRHFDSLLRSSAFADAERPDVILRLGETLASKSTSQWISACAENGSVVIAATPHGRRIDPERVAAEIVPEAGFAERLLAALGPVTTDIPSRESQARWRHADEAMASRIDTALDEATGPTEPGIARSALGIVPTNGALVVSSSMPVRDVEWFGQDRGDIDVHANRGANGIDGVTSTAIGIALTGRPTVLLIGDVAFLHDSNALIALTRREIDLTIVVIDNNGGGIFSFLPQRRDLPLEEYEFLFGTPHGTDLAALATAHGITVETWSPTMSWKPGIRVIIGTTSRDANLDFHRRLGSGKT